MRVMVFGATGGSGRAAIAHLVESGHEVSAFARTPDPSHAARKSVSFVYGDVMDAEAVARALHGIEAVIVTLGISENPISVRLWGPKRTPLLVRSVGTGHIIAAMRARGLRKLVVQTSYGVGATRERLSAVDRLFFSLVLKPQIADTELQDRAVKASGLDWVLVQPVHLTDGDDDSLPFASTQGDIGKRAVSRNSVGRFLAQAVSSQHFVGQTVALSATVNV